MSLNAFVKYPDKQITFYMLFHLWILISILSALKTLLLSFLSLFLFVEKGKVPPVNRKEVKTCYGYSPCFACKSCNYCKYCNNGGTCGICASGKEKKVSAKPAKSPSYKSPSSISSQCRAKTKKGTRCSRSSRSNGYCWQHGGWAVSDEAVGGWRV